MFKQLADKAALPQSLLCTILVCLTIFFLVGCNSNYTLTGSTTNGNGHQGSTSNGGSGSTQTTGSTGSQGGSTGSGSTGGSQGGSTGGSQGGSNGGSQGGSTGAAAFQVTSVDLTVDPAHLGAMHCGNQYTFTYTATFHITPNGPGGVISFSYYTDPMAGPTDGTVTVAAGQTTATFQFSKSGQVGPAFTFPRYAGVIVSSPNSINSNQVKPDQQCYQ